MNKNVVLYASVHHHNTQRVAMQLAKDLQADIHDVLKDPSISIASYDTIILASGIYYGDLHEKIHDHIMKQEWKGTCWMNPPYGRQISLWVKKALDSVLGGQSLSVSFPRGRIPNGGIAMSLLMLQM